MISKFKRCRIICRVMPLCSPIRGIRVCKNFIQKPFCLTNDDEMFLSLRSKKLIIHLFLLNAFSSNSSSLSSKNSKFWALFTAISEKKLNLILSLVSIKRTYIFLKIDNKHSLESRINELFSIF